MFRSTITVGSPTSGELLPGPIASSNTADLGVGQIYIAEGEYDKAITAMQRKVLPSAISYYWLAVAYAGKGDKAKALGMLQKAFDAGFRDFPSLDANANFASLHTDPAYQDMVKKYRK